MKMFAVLALLFALCAAKTVNVEVSPSTKPGKFVPSVVSVEPGDTVSFTFKSTGYSVVSGNSYCCIADDQTQPTHFDSGKTNPVDSVFNLYIDPSNFTSGSRLTYLSDASADQCNYGKNSVGEIWVVADAGNNCTAATTYSECTDVSKQGQAGGRIPSRGACIWCGAAAGVDSTDGFCFEPYWSPQVGFTQDCPDDSDIKFIPDYECPIGYRTRVGCQSYPASVPVNKHVKGANPVCASTSESTILVAALSLVLFAILL